MRSKIESPECDQRTGILDELSDLAVQLRRLQQIDDAQLALAQRLIIEQRETSEKPAGEPLDLAALKELADIWREKSTTAREAQELVRRYPSDRALVELGDSDPNPFVKAFAKNPPTLK